MSGFDEDHPDARSQRYVDKGLDALHRGNGAKALKYFTRLVEIYTNAGGPTHDQTLVWKAFSAKALNLLGRHEEATALQEEVIAARTTLLGPDHADTLAIRGQLGHTLADQKRFAESRALQRELYADKVRALGPNHASTLNTIGNLADLYVLERRDAEAVFLYRELVLRRFRALGPDHADTVRTKATLERYSTAQVNDVPAFQRLTAELEDATRDHGANSEEAAVARGNLACEYLRFGDGRSAIALLVPFAAARAEGRPASDPDTLRTRHMLVEAVDFVGADSDDPDELEELVDQLAEAVGPLDLATMRTRAYLLGLHIRSGEAGPDEVAAFRVGLTGAFPPDHPIHDDIERFLDLAVQTFIIESLLGDDEDDYEDDEPTRDGVE